MIDLREWPFPEDLYLDILLFEAMPTGVFDHPKKCVQT